MGSRALRCTVDFTEEQKQEAQSNQVTAQRARDMKAHRETQSAGSREREEEDTSRSR